jgi:terminase small subunit-like protein
MGRPSLFTQEVADAICARLAEGESLRAICRDEEMPAISAVMRWLADDEHAKFKEQYARATILRADAKFEELDEVSESALAAESAVQVQGLRLKADNIKWQLARMNAKKYGDKMVHAGDADNPVRIDSVTRRIIHATLPVASGVEKPGV